MSPYFLNNFIKTRQIISLAIFTVFIITLAINPVYGQSIQQEMIPRLPAPGVMVRLSPEFIPAHLQGISIHPDNALQFDFLIRKGDRMLPEAQKQEEYKKLIKYFLASLTIPDEDQWVNLSPYEKDRIIKDNFGKTEMGRDLLAEDYILKQITSSLIYPEDGLGKKFWDKIYERAWSQYHTTNIPVNTFNKVWIVPDEAIVYESGNTAYILQSHLKVMLEEDYLSLQKHSGITLQAGARNTHTIGSQVIREIILPALQHEVNEGKNFANLRQMFSGMILAVWYKKALKASLLGMVYADKAKVKGVDQDPKNNQDIYRRYLKAFRKGVFNYIKEDVDKYTNEAIPRKYFSGGWSPLRGAVGVDEAQLGSPEVTIVDAASLSRLPANIRSAIGMVSEGDLDQAQIKLNESFPISDKAMRVDANAVDQFRTYADWLQGKNLPPGIRGIAFSLDMTGVEAVNNLNHLSVLSGIVFSSGFGELYDDLRRKVRESDRFSKEDFFRSINEVIREQATVGQSSKAPIEHFADYVESLAEGKVGYPGRSSGSAAQREFANEGHAFAQDGFAVFFDELRAEVNRQLDSKGWLSIHDVIQIGREIVARHRAARPAASDDAEKRRVLNGWRYRFDNFLTNKDLTAAEALLVQVDEYSREFNEIDQIILRQAWGRLESAKESRDLLNNWLRRFNELINAGQLDTARGILDAVELRRSELNAHARGSLDNAKRRIEFELKKRGLRQWETDFNEALRRGNVEEARKIYRGVQSLVESYGTEFPLGPVFDRTKMERAYSRLSAVLLDTEQSPDPFAVLGLPFGATQDEVKKAYRRLARQHHSDLNPGDKKAEERFKAIQNAYDLLKSNGNRAMITVSPKQHSRIQDPAMNGGIDFNSANLAMIIKHDGKGVPLPLAQQDMAQLSRIQGFDPEIIAIKPALHVPIMSELQQKLQS